MLGGGFIQSAEPARAQVDWILGNVSAICEAAGTSLEHVCKRQCFHTDFAWFAESIDAWSRHFPGVRPASTTVELGGRLPVDVKVTSTAGIRVLVDVEIYSPSGEKVHQQAFDNQSFGPGETKAFTTIFPVPPGAAPGEYVVKVGVFTPGWGKVYDWNDNAAKFTVGR